jgi:hypothetical protein
MSSVLEDIFAEIDTRLAAIAAAETGSYERMPSGDPDLFPALAAYDRGAQPDEEPETGTDRMWLNMTVDGFVEGYSGAATHDALSDLHAKAVLGLIDDGAGSNLGGVPGVESIELGARRVDVAELASKRRLGFEQDFRIQYSTVRGDPSQPA